VGTWQKIARDVMDLFEETLAQRASHRRALVAGEAA